MDELRELIKYMEDVAGVIPDAKPMPKAALAVLPVYLASAFIIHEVHLFGHSIVIAIPKANEKPNLAQLAKERELLATKLGKDVVLILPQIKSYERRRLVQKQVPFIVPGRQMFLPMLLVDLRESFPTRISIQKDTLSWVAQVMLIRHITTGDITGRPLAMLAKVLGYTAMAITQGLDELSALGFCQRVQDGRARTIRFELAPGDLWREALPHLRSPVKRRYWVRRLSVPNACPLHAGMTALSEATTIASLPKNILAMSAKNARKAMDEGAMDNCPFEEDATIVVEAWAYAPKILSEGPSVDPLSLYLTMKDDPDERVQMAIEQIVKELWT